MAAPAVLVPGTIYLKVQLLAGGRIFRFPCREALDDAEPEAGAFINAESRPATDITRGN
jgi:hypothetical protein